MSLQPQFSPVFLTPACLCRTLNWVLSSTSDLKVTSKIQAYTLLYPEAVGRLQGKNLLYFNILMKYKFFST